MNNKEIGNLGEEIAKNYLISKNIAIINTNYRIRSGEIDIIGCENNELIFIEVKSRNTLKYGMPSESITKSKINKIKNTAKYYLYKNKVINKSIRFDVIEVYLNENKINHIVNAF